MNVSERQILVSDFHRMNSEPINDAPEPPSDEQAVLRAKFIMEEALELIDALGVQVHLPISDHPGMAEGDVDIGRLEFHNVKEPNLVAAVDALRDLECHIYGVELVLGVHSVSEETFLEVHRSNMDKRRVACNEKAMKPPGWKPPRIAEILRKRFPKKALLFRPR